jgi:hypothetical protein
VPMRSARYDAQEAQRKLVVSVPEAFGPLCPRKNLLSITDCDPSFVAELVAPLSNRLNCRGSPAAIFMTVTRHSQQDCSIANTRDLVAHKTGC